MAEDEVSTLGDWLQDFLNTIYHLFIAPLVEGFTGVETTLTGVASEVESLLEGDFSSLEGAIAAIPNTITLSLEDAFALYEVARKEGEQSIKDTVEESEHSLLEFVQTQFIDVTSILRLFEDDVGESFGGIAELVTGSIIGTLDVLGGLLDTIVDALGDLWTLFLDSVVVLFELLSNIINMDAEGIVDTIMSFVDVQGEVSKKMLEKEVS